MPPDEGLIQFYSQPAGITRAGPHGETFTALSTETKALCRIVQGLLVHRGWVRRYGMKPTEDQRMDPQTRMISKMLGRLLERDPRPLVQARVSAGRFLSTCRDFAVLMVAVLRSHGLPARARCGFATYFQRGLYEDHWICERWDAPAGVWTRVDAQIDEIQAEVLSLDFDPCDVPADKFLVAGEVRAQCAAGEIEPEACGADRFRGQWFVRNNVLRDLAALNGVEVLPWDEWGLALQPTYRTDDSGIIEQAASIGRSPGRDLASIRELYESTPGLRIVDWVRNSETGDLERLPGVLRR